jgi:hypothetical protein
MYRTSDRGRQRPDGTVEFLGRDDDQVKIRGNRVELEEIAAVLRDHPSVRDAVVRAPLVAGEPAVVAYVTLSGNGSEQRVDQDQLLAFVGRRLPEYMTPTAVVVLAALPLTPHGKLDVGSLTAPQQKHREAEGASLASEGTSDGDLARGPQGGTGWSMGGLVAYEMAQQLAAEGARVDRVILIDTVVPRVGGAATSDAQLRAHT